MLASRAATFDQYTVERAIGDPIIYRDNFSLVSGLEYVALAIDQKKKRAKSTQ